MPLCMSRRAGESFSIRSADGANWVRVKLLTAGEEPLLSIEAPRHLRICKGEWPAENAECGARSAESGKGERDDPPEPPALAAAA